MCTHPAVNNGNLESCKHSTVVCTRCMRTVVCVHSSRFLHNTPRRPQPHHRVHWTTGASAHMRMPASPQRQNTRIRKVTLQSRVHECSKRTTDSLTTSMATADTRGVDMCSQHNPYRRCAQSQRLLGLLWKKGTAASCGPCVPPVNCRGAQRHGVSARCLCVPARPVYDVVRTYTLTTASRPRPHHWKVGLQEPRVITNHPPHSRHSHTARLLPVTKSQLPADGAGISRSPHWHQAAVTT